MLATMNGSLPQLDSSQSPRNYQLGEDVNLEDRLCPGCKRSAVPDNGGVVVAFGQSFFHVDCFRCAKCTNRVTADTNLLLLSDGSPVCADCSYSCSMCNQPILDEAIMTGEESYHAHCFICKICKNRIPELMFAKTSQGIYCMPCHHERMAKIRRHNERKAERAAGGSSSSRRRPPPQTMNSHSSRETAASPIRETSLSNKSQTASSHADPSKTSDSPYSSRPETTQRSKYSVAQRGNVPDLMSAKPPPSPTHPFSVTVAPPPKTPPKDESTVFYPPPRDSSFAQSGAADLSRGNAAKQNTLPLSSAPREFGKSRRKSYDDGVRPLDIFFRQDDAFSDQNGTLSDADIPKKSKEKRRSINPGLVLSPNSLKSSATGAIPISSNTLSPVSATFLAQHSGVRSPTPPSATAHDSSRAPSPLRSQYQDSEASSRRVSGSSVHSNFRSASSSFHPSDVGEASDSQDQTIVLQADSGRNSLSPRETRSRSASVADTPLRPKRSFESRPNESTIHRLSDTGFNGRMGTSSPSRTVDVPHGIESGTDTEAEREEGEFQRSSLESIPPALPPKEQKDSMGQSPASPMSDAEPNAFHSQQDSSAEDDNEEPVERTSHATYIAPALPPIRFSLNTSDFSEMFSNVSKSQTELQHLSIVNESLPLTPPPTAASTSSDLVALTPTSDTTFTDSRTSTAVATSTPERLSIEDSRRPSTSDRPNETTTEMQDVNLPIDSIVQTPIIITPSVSQTSSLRQTPYDTVLQRLQEVLSDAKERGAQQLKLDRGFVEAIVNSMASRKAEYTDLKGKFDGVKRASMQYIEGLTVAQTEYDQELLARRNAEAEVTRLRVLLSGQAARLTAMSGDSKRQELRQQMSKELNENLSGLEHDLSKLKVQRDMAIAEVEELSAKSVSEPTSLSRSLTTRLEKLKNQYQRELLPLTEQREVLKREVQELKAERDVFLEETTVLNRRNEELAQLSAQYARHFESNPSHLVNVVSPPHVRGSDDRPRHMMSPQHIAPAANDDPMDLRGLKMLRTDSDLQTPPKPKFIKWPGSRPKESTASPQAGVGSESRSKQRLEHNFQQLSVLRFTRCDHCGDKMWGSQLRCTACNISVHARCINHVQVVCTQQNTHLDETPAVPLPPSMFGRDLAEQVAADAKGSNRQVPVIVEKCIEAVEALALDYEGIYRKTGGLTQSKIITQLFERGDYASFDLRDSDRFNDVCSITSVLKTYFRSLPIPLLTYALHDQFTSAIEIKDNVAKQKTLLELVSMLPDEHYYTLRLLMQHLHRVYLRSDINLMSSRNLGVVFGPTLMRSANPGAEFSDMAGKALTIEWLIENAPHIFNQNTARARS